MICSQFKLCMLWNKMPWPSDSSLRADITSKSLSLYLSLLGQSQQGVEARGIPPMGRNRALNPCLAPTKSPPDDSMPVHILINVILALCPPRHIWFALSPDTQSWVPLRIWPVTNSTWDQNCIKNLLWFWATLQLWHVTITSGFSCCLQLPLPFLPIFNKSFENYE